MTNERDKAQPIADLSELPTQSGESPTDTADEACLPTDAATTTRAPWLEADENDRVFTSIMGIKVDVHFKKYRIGTSGTIRRRKWIKNLLEQLEEPLTYPMPPPFDAES